MRIIIFPGLILLCCLSCTANRTEDADREQREENTAVVFDEAKWKMKEGKDYPYRASMANDVLYNDTVRSLNEIEIIGLLGAPDRVNENFLYYQIRQKRIASWPLHTKSMVIKLTGDGEIEWIKIHE